MQTLFKSAIAASLSMLVVAAPALAHAPSVNILTIGGQDATAGTVTLNVPMLPYTVDVAGTVAHEDPGNLNGVKLSLSDNAADFYGPVNYFAGIGNVGTANFTAPWSVTSTGSHQIVATVKHGNADGTDTVDVTVNLNLVVNQCPAAPAIAVDYLKTLGIKPNSTLSKNLISQVGQQTGSNGTLWAAHSCDPGYREAVISFVNSIR